MILLQLFREFEHFEVIMYVQCENVMDFLNPRRLLKPPDSPTSDYRRDEGKPVIGPEDALISLEG